MSYSEVLKQYIEKSELSLSEIEERLREKGHSTNKAYISRLQNGKIPPAGDEINKALAEVMNQDATELILWANIEKAPVLGEIIETFSNGCVNLLKQNKEILVDVLLEQNKDSGIPKDVLLTMVTDESIDEMFKSFTLSQRVEILNTLLEATKKVKLDHNEGKMLEIDELIVPFSVPPSMFGFNTYDKRLDSYLTEDEVSYLKKQLDIYRELKLNLMKE